MSNIFQSCNIYLSTVSNKQTLSKTIKDNGGSVSFMLTKNVTHFVCDEKEVQSDSFNYKKAKGYNIPIVSEEFITESVSKSSRLRESDFGFDNVKKVKPFSYFDSPSKSPIKSPIKSPEPIAPIGTVSFTSSTNPLSFSPSSSSSSWSSSNTFTTSTTPIESALPILPPKAIAKKTIAKVVPNPSTSSTTSYTPISSSSSSYSTTSYTTPISSFSSTQSKPTIEIKSNPKKITTKLYPLNDSRQPSFAIGYEVLVSHTLQFTNLTGISSNNKYYHLELQKDSQGIHRVYTSYGRTDGPKTLEVRYVDNLEDGIDLYSSIYNEKTSDKKGYKPVKLDSSSVSSSTSTESLITADSQLEPLIKTLVENLYVEATTQLTNSFSVTITERGIETPLGVLSMEQVENGELVLKKINTYLNGTTNPSSVELEKLSSEFFTIIPHKLGRGSDVVSKNTIRNLDQLNTKFELLQLMKDLLVVKVSGTGKHALDMKYRALKTNLSPLGKYSYDYSVVKNLLKGVEGINDLNIYQIQKEGDVESHSLQSPSKLLFHGSRASNFVGILSRGLLLPKVIVNNGGGRTDFGYLGAGIYFGDGFDTALKYAHPSLSNGKRYALVSKVGLGRVSNHLKINSSLTQPPSGFDSCLGIKKNSTNQSDFHDNEYVIYNTNQYRQEYLIEFTFSGVINSHINNNNNPVSSITSSFNKLNIIPTPVAAVEPKKRTKEAVASVPIASISTFVPLQVPTPPTSVFFPTTTTTTPVATTNLESSMKFNEFVTSFNNISIGDKSIYQEDSTENEYRKLFVNNRNDSKLNNLYLHCEKVFKSKPTTSELPNVNGVDCIMGFNAKQHSFSNDIKFKQEWNRFSNNMFDGFNWSNVFIAGGSVLGCSLEGGIIGNTGFQNSDIDIFLYGLSEDGANSKLDEIEQFIKSKSPQAQMARTKYAITFVSGSGFRNVQIVLRIYKSPAEVLMGFDIDCCSIGFDGTDVYAMPRAIKAVTTSCNIVSMSRRSLTYETRLFKYALRGFSIRVPNLDKRKIPMGQICSSDGKGSTGLLRLLIMEFKFVTGKGDPSSFNLGGASASDYSEIEIPNGQNWSVNSAVNFINYKEKSQFFAKKKHGFKHCHLIVVGTQAKEGKASWCKKCKQGHTPENSDSQDVVTGPIKWITENPGQQILTGSFHPVNDNSWYDLNQPSTTTTTTDKKGLNYYKYRIINNLDVSDIPDYSPRSLSSHGPTTQFLIDSNNLLSIAAGFGSNVSLKSMLSTYKQYVNTIDDLGYYPIHYASFSGNKECLELLLQNNASTSLRNPSYGLTCAMLCKFYNHNDAFNRIISHSPRVFKIKCYLNKVKNLRQWNLLSSAHNTEPAKHLAHPPMIIPSSLKYDQQYLFKSVYNSDLELIKKLLSLPEFKECFDPLGNSLFHYAVLSPYPESVIALLKEKGLDINTTPTNIFGQSVLHFAKSTIGTIQGWTKTIFPLENLGIKLSPIYLHNQLSQIIQSLSKNSNNNSDNFVSKIPSTFMKNYVNDNSFTILNTLQQPQTFGGFGSTSQSFGGSTMIGGGFGSTAQSFGGPGQSFGGPGQSFGPKPIASGGFGSTAIPFGGPGQSFGGSATSGGFGSTAQSFGGPKPTTIGSSGFGSTAVSFGGPGQPFGGSATSGGFGSSTPQSTPAFPSSFGIGGKFAAKIPPSASIPASGFVPLASNISATPTGLFSNTQHSLKNIPQNMGGSSVSNVSLSIAKPATLLNSTQFLESSVMAQCLYLVDDLSTTKKLPDQTVKRIKELLFSLYLPIFNCFEAFLLNTNEKALIENLLLALKNYDQKQ
ncbi:ankyrin repeat-containing protein [Dictyostelium discoideum AX4]|uniref:Poly [ADP-ribose] polymerase n=1 Tax=Dictyostelium discoideum TaxID=44689 RepID=Q54HY5_DICDI|nr:ankyrin repeat-containing protein [Dictyostelium discoideum AX4]EAL62878.2 ankyrin repeat-containing protein [Dictyostelium discoideum AX4]|eukprot:XP_636378.2 ankyrin repeat-containing protein [Dictyostelium discoideum AX4]